MEGRSRKSTQAPFEVVSEAELLIQIVDIAYKAACQVGAGDMAEDIAQEVVGQCLEKVRAGKWEVPNDQLASLVFCIVRRRLIDLHRRQQTRLKAESAFALEQASSVESDGLAMVLARRAAIDAERGTAA